MIARIRGEHDAHWGRWRPSASRLDGVSQVSTTARRRGERSVPRRAFGWFLVIVVALAVGYLAASLLRAEPSRVAERLPATPRAWLDAYEAAAIDNPARVCSELFSPQLARAYGRATGGSCTRYFARITSFSVMVRRVLQDRDTAVLEMRQTVRPRDWAVVLTRRPGGWQAVDLLPGELLR
jgi:hypothetical protein